MLSEDDSKELLILADWLEDQRNPICERLRELVVAAESMPRKSPEVWKNSHHDQICVPFLGGPRHGDECEFARHALAPVFEEGRYVSAPGGESRFERVTYHLWRFRVGDHEYAAYVFVANSQSPQDLLPAWLKTPLAVRRRFDQINN